MSESELRERVDLIIGQAGDPEMAHSNEDDLRLEVIERFCPPAIYKEIKRLADADFPRWCA